MPLTARTAKRAGLTITARRSILNQSCRMRAFTSAAKTEICWRSMRATGKLLWRYRTKGAVRGPVANGNDVVYFGSGDGYVYAVNATNWRLIWRKRTGAGVQACSRR